MFLDSIIGAMISLSYWEIYAAGVMFVIVSFLPIFLISLAFDRFQTTGILSVFVFLLQPIFSASATLIFVFSLAPIILGLSDDAAWSLPWSMLIEAPWPFTKAALYLVLASILVSILPIIGHLNSLHSLIVGGVALVMFLGMLDRAGADIFAGVDLYPGFWFSLGILVVGSVIGSLAIILALIPALILSKLFGGDVEGLGMLIALPLAPTLGFIPLFIYADCLAAQAGF